MRTILILVGNELRRFVHDKTALSLTFLVPVILIYIFGHVFGVTEGGGGPTGIPIAVVSETEAPVAATITAALRKEKAFKVLTTEKQGDKEGAAKEYQSALTLAKDYGRAREALNRINR